MGESDYAGRAEAMTIYRVIGASVLREERAVLDFLCDGCGQMVDPDVCYCGIGRQFHGAVEQDHKFVPMGCGCARLES